MTKAMMMMTYTRPLLAFIFVSIILVLLVACSEVKMCTAEALEPEDEDVHRYSLPGDALWPTIEELDVLHESVRGNVYDARSRRRRAARPSPYWYGNYGSVPRPGVVVEAIDPADVAVAIAFAKRFKLRIAVFSTGHDFNMRSVVENGMLINMSRMDAIDVDEDAGVVAVGTGAVYRDILRAVNSETAGRMTVTSGYHPTVGPYGFTSGGGIAVTSGLYGNGADSIVGVECVLGDGSFVKAMEGDDEHAELLRAVRGGGSSFCVATTMFLRLVPELSPVHAYITVAFRMTGREMEQIRAFASDGVPPTVFFWMQHIRPAFPTIRYIAGCYNATTEEECKDTLGPLLSIGPGARNRTAVDMARFESHYDFMSDVMFGFIPTGTDIQSVYQTSVAVPAEHLAEPGALDILYAFSRGAPMGTIASFNIRPLGGAALDPDGSKTSVASSFRNATLFVNCLLTWGPAMSSARATSYIEDFYENELRRLGSPDGWQYINEASRIPNFGARLWHGGAEGYERLRLVRQRYDPEGLFLTRHGIGSEALTDGPGADPERCAATCRMRRLGCTNVGDRNMTCAPLPQYESRDEDDAANALLLENLQATRTHVLLEILMNDK